MMKTRGLSPFPNTTDEWSQVTMKNLWSGKRRVEMTLNDLFCLVIGLMGIVLIVCQLYLYGWDLDEMLFEKGENK